MLSLFPATIEGANQAQAEFKVISSLSIAYLSLPKPFVNTLYKALVEYAKTRGIQEEILEPPLFHSLYYSCIQALGSNITLVPPKEFNDQLIKKVKQECLMRSNQRFLVTCKSIHKILINRDQIEQIYTIHVKIDKQFQTMRQSTLNLKNAFPWNYPFNFIIGIVYRNQLPKIISPTKYFNYKIISLSPTQRKTIYKITKSIKQGDLVFVDGSKPYLFLQVSSDPVKEVYLQLKKIIPTLYLPPRFEKGIGAHITLVSTEEFLNNPSLVKKAKLYLAKKCSSIPIKCSDIIVEITKDPLIRPAIRNKTTSVWNKISRVWAIEVVDYKHAFKNLRASLGLQPFSDGRYLGGVVLPHITIGVEYNDLDLDSQNRLSKELSKERDEVEAILLYYAREDQALEEFKEYPLEVFTHEHQEIALQRGWDAAFLFMNNDVSFEYISLTGYRRKKKKNLVDKFDFIDN